MINIPLQTKENVKNITYLGKRLGDMQGDELWEAIAGMINYFKQSYDRKQRDYKFMSDLASRRP